MRHLIEDFIEQTNALTTRAEIFIAYQQAIARFGYDSAVYTFVTDHPTIGEKAGHGVQCNYPEDWMNYYAEKKYIEIDPVTKHAFRTAAPFSWEQLVNTRLLDKSQLLILQEAKDAGLNGGVGVPLYGPRGEIAGIGLAGGSEEIRPDKNVLSKLKLLSEQFHLAYCSAEAPRSLPEVAQLTSKETEILKWMAAGKTADEIALIVGCARTTVKFHISNIYLKLGANSKTLAVMKAVWQGLIPLDVLAA